MVRDKLLRHRGLRGVVRRAERDVMHRAAARAPAREVARFAQIDEGAHRRIAAIARKRALARRLAEATREDTCLARAFREALKEFPGEQWSSLVVVLKRVDDPSDSAIADRGTNTTQWTEGIPLNQLPLPSRGRSPHRSTQQPPLLPSVPQTTARLLGEDQSVGR